MFVSFAGTMSEERFNLIFSMNLFWAILSSSLCWSEESVVEAVMYSVASINSVGESWGKENLNITFLKISWMNNSSRVCCGGDGIL